MFASHLHQVMLVLSDKIMMILYLTKQTGIHSALLCGLAWPIFQFAQSLALKIQVRQIPGKCNVLMDFQSWRSPVQTEWALNPSVFQAVVAHFGIVTSNRSAVDSPEFPTAGVYQSIPRSGSIWS